MKKSIMKLPSLVLGLLFLVYLLHGLQGGGSLDEDLLMGRKLKSLKSIESKNVAAGSLKDSTSVDLEKEIDNLMRNEYPSPVKPRKRTPVHN
ncbi:unnamed protein product [Microthlaspi erraticum]|uniref:Uncharacterized protein n=1 Tax=Microthlaspi erraticum TaxID=1685480 RepID=A0A6D2HPD8_9BRAS|nr:unnamed protein product [Microthlaspi erraticum]